MLPGCALGGSGVCVSGGGLVEVFLPFSPKRRRTRIFERFTKTIMASLLPSPGAAFCANVLRDTVNAAPASVKKSPGKSPGKPSNRSPAAVKKSPKAAPTPKADLGIDDLLKEARTPANLSALLASAKKSKTPASRAEKHERRSLSFMGLDNVVVPERESRSRLAKPTPARGFTKAVSGDFTPLKTVDSPNGEQLIVGLFHPAGTTTEPLSMTEPLSTRASPLAPPPSPSASGFVSPKPAIGRVNMHIKFGADASPHVVDKSSAPVSRPGCWVASSPLGACGEASPLTLWHKCDEPPAEADADAWTDEEWAAWDHAQWATWEAEEWDEWAAEADAEAAADVATEAARPNTHIRFPTTPISSALAEGVLEDTRGATPTAHKGEGRAAAAQLAMFVERADDAEWLPSGKVLCTTTGHELPPNLHQVSATTRATAPRAQLRPQLRLWPRLHRMRRLLPAPHLPMP